MVINIDAFRRSFTDPTKETKANIIHRTNDRLNGMRPIELIQETRPFVIIDEPQSVDTTLRLKRQLSPLILYVHYVIQLLMWKSTIWFISWMQ